MFQARLHRHIPGRCSLESRTLRHQRGSFESPTYFSLFYEGSREAIVNRITFVSSTSKTIGIRHQKWCRSSFISGFCLLNPSNSETVVGVTKCHADDGRRIADRYSQRQRPAWLSRSPAAKDVGCAIGVQAMIVVCVIYRSLCPSQPPKRPATARFWGICRMCREYFS